MEKKLKVLVDLKPALDGYAGIPQECRLLFLHLSKSQALACDGLVQHGGRRLAPALTERDSDRHASVQVTALARFAISFTEDPHRSWLVKRRGKLRSEVEVIRLILDRLLGRAADLTEIPPGSLQNFLWETLFEKTIDPEEIEWLALQKFKVLEPSRNSFNQVGLMAPSDTKVALFPIIDTSGYDVFISQTPLPAELRKGSALVVRYHDAVPMLQPHTVNEKAVHHASHQRALRSNIAGGALFSCISESTRQDLISIYPEAEDRAEVIPNMVAKYYVGSIYKEPLSSDARRYALETIFDTRRHGGEAIAEIPKAEGRFLLMVSTLEPRKNHRILIRAWESMLHQGFSDVSLVIVGGLGWSYQPILKSMATWIQKGRIIHLSNVPADELTTLYRCAAVVVCPSLAEGFDYSGVEALMCGSMLASSELSVHREVFGDASEYFNPFSVEAAADAIGRCISHPRSLSERRRVAHELAARYSTDAVMPKWERLLQRAADNARASRA